MDAPVTILTDWITNKLKDGAAELLADYIAGLPVMIIAGLGVYVLLNMISSKLANLGVFCTFGYGFLIILV